MAFRVGVATLALTFASFLVAGCSPPKAKVYTVRVSFLTWDGERYKSTPGKAGELIYPDYFGDGFNGNCSISDANGNRESQSIGGFAERIQEFTGTGISCSAQSQGSTPWIMEMVITDNNGDVLGRSRTSDAHGVVSVSGD